MEANYDQSLILIGLVLFFGLFIPQALYKLRLPSTSSLILTGFLFGPMALNYIQPDETLKFFAFLGATFHMLLAGFESEKLHIDQSNQKLWAMVLINGLIPAAIGTAITRYFGYDWIPSLLIGAVFLSSSIMLVFSYVRHLEINRKASGRLLRSLTVINDLMGTLLIFLIFKSTLPPGRFSLPILLGLLFSSVVILRMFLPEMVAFFFQRLDERKDEKEGKLRLVLALLIGVVILYSAFGVHPIVGAFLVGFSLASIPGSENIREKLRVMGHGVFIPIFLFTMGAESDLSILLRIHKEGIIVLSLVFGAFFAKLLTGYLGAKILGISHKESAIIGLSTTTKLTVSLTAIYAAFEAKLVDQNLFTSVVILSVFSSIVVPIILNSIKYFEKKETT